MLFRDRCYDNFWLFVLFPLGAKFYCENHSGEDWIEPDKHQFVCDWIEYRTKDWENTRHLQWEFVCNLLMMPRGTAKTVIATIGRTVWTALRNPDAASYIDSYDLDMSKSMLSVVKQIWGGTDGNGWFAWLYGDWTAEGDNDRVWTKDAVVHAKRTGLGRKDKSIECTSVTTGLTGSHPDDVAEDDPVTEEKLRDVKTGSTWLKVVEQHQKSLRFAMLRTSQYWRVMTPYRENDCAIKAMRIDGVKSWAPTGCFPRERHYRNDPEKGRWNVLYLPGRDPFGNATFPKTWPNQRIDAEMARDPQFTSSQVLLDPVAGKHMLLDLDVAEKYKILTREVPKNTRVSLHLDTAFKDMERRQKGDNNAIVVAEHALDGSGIVYYVECIFSNEGDEDDFCDQFVIVLQRLRARGKTCFGVTDERPVGGKTNKLWERALRNACHRAGIPMPHFYTIQRSGHAKNARITSFAGFIKTGYARFCTDGEGVNRVLDEVVFYQQMDTDDCADAGADAWYHEIYRGVPVNSGNQYQPPTRPYDEELRGISPAYWTADERHAVARDIVGYGDGVSPDMERPY